MQTDYVRYFIDVATLGSMSAAAKKNFMTPQGISRSITALESELGCELFQRDSNKVTLTKFGKRLLPDAKQLMEHESSMRQAIVELHSENFKKRRTHFICYSSPIFFDTPLFFPVSGLETTQYGRVQFLQRSTTDVVSLLVNASRVNQGDAVVAGGLSLISMFPEEGVQTIQQLRDAGYEYHPFIRTPDYVLVPESSPLAELPSLPAEELRKHNLAVASGGGMERAVTSRIGGGNIYVSAGDSAYRSYLCRTGEALTFVPGISLAYGVPEGTVAVSMEEPYLIEVAFVAHRNVLREGVLADALDRLRDFYGKNRAKGAYELLDGTLESSLFSPLV